MAGRHSSEHYNGHEGASHPTRNQKEGILAHALKTVVSKALAIPELMPSTARAESARHKKVDFITFTKALKPTLLAVSTNAYKYLRQYGTLLERSAVNSRMGKETTAGRTGPQNQLLQERALRIKQLRGQVRLAHNEIGLALNEVATKNDARFEQIAEATLARFEQIGQPVDPQEIAQKFVADVVREMFFPFFEEDEMAEIAEFIPRSFPPFMAVAFLGEGKVIGKIVTWLAHTLGKKVYQDRDRLLGLLATKVHEAREHHPLSMPTRIWNALCKEAETLLIMDLEGVIFPGDAGYPAAIAAAKQQAVEFADAESAAYLMSIFQAAADTTTNPAANGITLLGLPENAGMRTLGEGVYDAAAYVGLQLNSPLAVDPFTLTSPLQIGAELYPAGTSIGLGLSEIALRELNEYVGFDATQRPMKIVVEAAMDEAEAEGDDLRHKAESSPAFKTGFPGACIGNNLAISELRALFKSIISGKYGVATIKPGEQKTGLLLSREGALVQVVKRP